MNFEGKNLFFTFLRIDYMFELEDEEIELEHCAVVPLTSLVMIRNEPEPLRIREVSISTPLGL